MKEYSFRLSIGDETDIDKIGNRLKIIYDMLKDRENFPTFDKIYSTESKKLNPRILDEFKNFTQFFPKCKFVLWISFNNGSNLFILEMKNRKIMSKRTIINNEVKVNGRNNVLSYKIHFDDIMIKNEVTRYLI